MLRLIDGGISPPIAFPLFDSILDRTGRRQITRLAALVAATRGEVLAEQGEPGRDFLVLADGIVKLWKVLPNGRRQIVAFRAAGDLISLHRRGTPWPVTAQAVSNCRFFKLDWEALRRFAGRHPEIDQALIDLASDEITSLQDRLLTLGCKTVEEKLASFILEFCHPLAAPTSLSREVHLPMRRPEIAEYLGLTTESVSREFSRLKRQSIVSMPRPSRIIVLNRPALEAIAMGLQGAAQEDAWPSRLPSGGQSSAATEAAHNGPAIESAGQPLPRETRPIAQ